PCPVLVEGIAGVESGLCFDEVTCEEDLVFGQPGDDVALGVAAAEVLQDEFASVAPQVDGGAVGEGLGGPGQAGYGVGVLGQSGHAGECAGPVCFAAFSVAFVGCWGVGE